MLTKDQAQSNLKIVYPEATVKVWTTYLHFYLFRVEHPSESEKDWDPFFSVDTITGEVRDFSIIGDISTEEFNTLEWNDI